MFLFLFRKNGDNISKESEVLWSTHEVFEVLKKYFWLFLLQRNILGFLQQRELQLNKVYRETGILRLVHLKTSFTDFGRACRYNNADNKDSLPVILLSSAAKKRCQTDQMTRRGQFKTSGFHKMKPDYDNKMIEDPEPFDIFVG